MPEIIALLGDMLTTGSSVTAATNAVWGGVGLCMAVGLHLLVKFRADLLPDYVLESFKWGRLPGLCVWMHRSYWNLAIFFAPSGATYAPFFTDNKHWLAFLVLGIVVGTVKATTPFIDQSIKSKVLSIAFSFLIASAIVSAYLALP